MLLSASSTNSSIDYQKLCTTIPTGLGLLTTVAQLPPKYKIRYLARTALLEKPLDLTVKQDVSSFLQNATIVNQIELQNTSVENTQKNYKSLTQHPITPPPSPPKKRYRDDGYQSSDSEVNNLQSLIKIAEDVTETDVKGRSLPLAEISNEQKTPTKPIKITNSAPRTGKSNPNTSREKKSAKAIRKLKFDEETSSPVSGTIIRSLEEIKNSGEEIESGDIDPEFNIVEVTDEAKEELAQIKNVIGSYTCKLCKIEFEDAFGLARHRCSCIVLLEYRCPECGKRFNCPANLASHRRWHKPKEEVLRKQQESSENDQQYPCLECGKNFKRQAYLRKHLTTHKHKEESTKRKASNKSSAQGNKKKMQKLNDERASTASSLDDEVLHQNSNFSNSLSIIEDSNHSKHSIQHSLPSNSSNSNYCNDSYSNNSTLYKNNNNSSSNNHDNGKYDSEYSDSRSDCSSPGRLQIIDDHNNLTEEENIAAAALAHLRNGPSVIQHTTATMVF